MKVLLKILKITAILIVAFSVILFSASLFLQDRVGGYVLKTLNNNISTRLDIGSFRLSFLKKFPRASLELKDVLAHTSPDFDHTRFPGIDTDTLLSANSVSIEFSFSDILRGNYNIDRIGIKTGKLILLSDSSGHVNYEIKTNKATGKTGRFELNLERINLSDITTTYCNLATKLLIQGGIESGRLKSKISDSSIDFSANSTVHIILFQLYNTKLTKGVDAQFDVSLYSSGSNTLFRKGTLKVDNLVFNLTGTVAEDNFLDLDITGQKIDLSKVKKFLPDSLRYSLKDYDPSGILKMNAKVKGVLSRTLNPHIEITASLGNGRLKYGKSHFSIDDLNFSGVFSNGKRNLPETSNLSVNDISMKLGSSQFTGSFNLAHFDHPETSIVLNGTLKPGELIDFFNVKSVSSAGGSADVDLKLEGKFIRKEKYSINDFLDLKTEADIKFNSFSFGLKNGKLTVGNVTGKIRVSDTITADNLSLTYKNHIIKIDGEFRNLPGWLAGRHDKIMIGSADVSLNRLDPIQLFSENKSNSEKLKKRAFLMPGDMILNLNFQIDTFLYKTFIGEKIKGTLNYKPNALTFNSLQLNSQGGIIKGNGAIFQNTDKSIIAKGTFNLEKIDIHKAFTTFNNFGQNFLKAENLAGTVSGSLSLLLPMDAFLKPEIKAMTAVGKYTVTKGSLINFDPVKRLSSYIKLSELENISFEKLENDFFIRNNFLYIPQMDVKSSAVELSVNGKHSFDNDYEYHVKMLLSEILSKKFRKNRSFQSEFGFIEDDGLGRTSLLLKIVSKGEDVKVGYDMKAAASEIKNDIKEEKQSLKTILNEEYGLYKNDTSVIHKKEEKRPRFRVTWDESGDSVKTIPEIPAEKNPAPFKNIFKKK